MLQGLHRTWPPLIDFAPAARRRPRPPGADQRLRHAAADQGFATHYDVHDVFVLQVAGEKRWRIHAPVLAAPAARPALDRPAGRGRGRAAAEEPLIDTVLRPGDALYLPAGFLHAAEALGETERDTSPSASTPGPAAHLLAELVRSLQAVEALREPLPLGIDVTDPASLGLELQETSTRCGPPCRRTSSSSPWWRG